MEWYQDEGKSPSDSTDSKLAVQTLAISFISHRWSLVGLSICLWLFSPFLVVSVRAFDYFEHKFIAENAFEFALKQHGKNELDKNIKESIGAFHFMKEKPCDPDTLKIFLRTKIEMRTAPKK